MNSCQSTFTLHHLGASGCNGIPVPMESYFGTGFLHESMGMSFIKIPVPFTEHVTIPPIRVWQILYLTYAAVLMNLFFLNNRIILREMCQNFSFLNHSCKDPKP